MNKLSFKLPAFEGPLDLLMHLIQKNKINIYDIPIAKITQQYLLYLENMQEMDLEVSSEFLMMAASLLYIKSKMLLPKHQDEEDEEEDPRQELVNKLLEYKKYKQMSKVLLQRHDHYQHVFFKEPQTLDFPDDPPQIIALSVEDLIKAFNSVLIRRSRLAPPHKASFDEIVRYKRVSVEQKRVEIMLLLKRKREITLMEVFVDTYDRPEIVAKFLAVLDLIKADVIYAFQSESDGEIYIVRSSER